MLDVFGIHISKYNSPFRSLTKRCADALVVGWPVRLTLVDGSGRF